MISDKVNGRTNVFGVIGNPIEHTFSPVIQNTFAEKSDKNIMYVPFKVESEGLKDAVRGAYELGIQGLNVTVPHKKAVMELLCGIDKQAEAIGAVNTLKYTPNGYIGYNTDIIGVYYSLKNKGVDVKGKTVLVLGAGGAANACVVMAAANGAEKVIIANRTLEKADSLRCHINKYYSNDITAMKIDDLESIEYCDIVMNATTLGFGDNVGLSPIKDKSFFAEKNVKVVFDAIYSPWETKLLSDAGESGVIAVNGFDMLVYQAVAAQEIWFEEKYPTELTEELKIKLSEYYKEQAR